MDAASPDRAARGHDLIVFDWDGTLIDSIASIVACTRATFDELEIAPVGEETIRGAIGLGLRETVERFHPDCDEELFHRILDTYRKHWLATYHSLHDPFVGVEAMLEELLREGYLLAIATAKGRVGLARDLDRTGLASFFHGSRTVDEAPSKPHPGMLESLVDELGVRPDRTLMVGDTRHDLEMARNARVAGVAVLTGSQRREQLEELRPVAVLPRATDLPSWLARQCSR